MIVSNFKIDARVQLSSGVHKDRVGIVTASDGRLATVLLDASNGDGAESVLILSQVGQAAIVEP